ncbi:MAG: hypothetical protein SAL70_30250 [Scytonema sp. PMC 1070.18]|nr:hypothetical protein [Scytonema sp. PMC 1070.18]
MISIKEIQNIPFRCGHGDRSLLAIHHYTVVAYMQLHLSVDIGREIISALPNTLTRMLPCR